MPFVELKLLARFLNSDRFDPIIGQTLLIVPIIGANSMTVHSALAVSFHKVVKPELLVSALLQERGNSEQPGGLRPFSPILGVVDWGRDQQCGLMAWPTVQCVNREVSINLSGHLRLL